MDLLIGIWVMIGFALFLIGVIKCFKEIGIDEKESEVKKRTK